MTATHADVNRRDGADEVRARVFDIQRFCVHDGPGIRTTVFLAGCPMRCAWCHNPESFRGSSGRWLSPTAVLGEVLADRDYYAESGGGLTVSGGEPLLHPRLLRSLLALAKQAGLHTCVQTAGAVAPDAILAVLDLVDLFQLDLKHMDSTRHRTLTGVGTEQIHANAALLLQRGACVELRMPLVPGVNDDAGNLDATAALLTVRGVWRLHLVPYQRSYLDKYERLGLEARCADVETPAPHVVSRVVDHLGRLGIEAIVDA